MSYPRPINEDLEFRFTLVTSAGAPVTGAAWNDAQWGTLRFVQMGDASSNPETITLASTGDYSLTNHGAGLYGVLIPATGTGPQNDGAGLCGIVGSYNSVAIIPIFEEVSDLTNLETLDTHIAGGGLATKAEIAQAVQDLQIPYFGVLTAASGTSITLAAGGSASDDAYNDHLLIIVGGTGAVQACYVVDYVGSTKVATVDRTLDPLPVNGSRYVLIKLA